MFRKYVHGQVTLNEYMLTSWFDQQEDCIKIPWRLEIADNRSKDSGLRKMGVVKR